MKYRVSHKDVDAFLKCPLLYYHFNLDSIPTAPREAVIVDCLDHVFTTNMTYELGTSHNKNIIRYWNHRYNDLIEAGHNKVQINSLNMTLLKLLEEINQSVFLNNFKTIALDFPLQYKYNKITYEDGVDFLLTDGIHVLPIYVIKNERIGSRDNRVRFLNALLSDRLKSILPSAKLVQYAVIQFNVKYLFVHFNMYSINEKHFINSIRDLSNVLKMIETNLEVPNTNSCINCSFRSQCRL